MWPEGEEPRQYDREVGSMIVPPNMWFHQHFNTGKTPARYLAFKHEVVSVRNAQGVPKAWISRRVGGDQIDYADESQLVRDRFADALSVHGLTPKDERGLRDRVGEFARQEVNSDFLGLNRPIARCIPWLGPFLNSKCPCESVFL
jgi:hypothetical protein